MFYNIIVFIFILLCLTVLLQYSKITKEGFFNIPVPAHNEFINNSQQKFNELTNLVNIVDPSIPITSSTSDNVNSALGLLSTTPSSTGFNLDSSIPYTTPDAVPEALETAKKCQEAANSCSAFDDPFFSQNCGMSFDSTGMSFDGKVFTGGLYISPNDRSVQMSRAKKVKDTGSEPYDPFKVYQPTLGKAKPGSFSLTKDQCVIVQEKVDCDTKQSFNSPNCTQCYTSRNFSRVGPETERIPSKLYLSGNGILSIRSQNETIRLDATPLSTTKPIEITIPGDAEGSIFDLEVTSGSTLPTYLAGFLEGKTARGNFKLDISRIIQSDKVINSKPRISGTKTVNNFRCLSFIPGNGKKNMVLACLMPFSFINMYDSDSLTCDNGPIITKEASATFLESDPCFSKENRPGNYKLECLQSRWTSLGGTQKGNGYPSTQDKANVIQNDSNGKPLHIDTIVDMIATKVRQAMSGKDENNNPLSISDWNNVSMWALGIPINTPCDGPDSEEGPLSRECLSYLYTNKGVSSHIGPTYSSTPGQVASMKDQTMQNTFCQPGAEMDPSTEKGQEFGRNLGGINSVKQKYDEMNRIANDNSKSNSERSEAVKMCYGVNLNPVTSNKVIGPTQVFAVGPGYVYSRDQAQGVCSQYGAQVATTKQLEEAQRNGADWCFTAWVADSNVAKYPITTSVMQGCGNGSSGIKEYIPDGNKAGVNCYGPKPGIDSSDGKILAFNPFMWDQPTETTYITTKGGYLESTGDMTCFNGLTPEQAQETCTNLGNNCAGFSYKLDGSGFGCYKGDMKGSFINNNDYIGYVKIPNVISNATVSGRYIKLQQKQIGCMNLSDIKVYSKNGNNIITPNMIVTKSSTFGNPDVFPGSLLVDGDINTFAHTSCSDIGWFLIDLGSIIPISKIVITNRTSCCRQRATGIVLTILDEQQNILYTANPITDKKNRTSFTENDNNDADFYLTFTYYPPNPNVFGNN